MSRLVILLVRAYQLGISPWLKPRCRHLPSCSVYAIESVEKYGAIRGLAKAAWRVLRCQPFGSSGYDPP